MIMRESALDEARSTSEAGCNSYKEQLVILPAVHFVTKRGVFLFWVNSALPPSEAAAKIVKIFARMLSARYITFQAEAWYRTYESEEEIGRLSRGDLQRQAEFDPSVRTAITTTVYDTRAPDQSASVIAVLNEKCLPNVEFATSEHVGFVKGAAFRGIHDGYLNAVEPPPFVSSMPLGVIIDGITKITEMLGDKSLWSSVGYAGDEDPGMRESMS